MIADISFGEYKGKNGDYKTIKIKDKVVDKSNSNLIQDNFNSYFNGYLDKFFNGDKICLDLSLVRESDSYAMYTFNFFRTLSIKNNYGKPYLIVKKDSSLEKLMKSAQIQFNLVNSRAEL